MANQSANRAPKLALGLFITAAFFGLMELGARLLFSTELAAAEAPPPQALDGAPTLKGNPYLLWEQAPGVRVEHNIPANINSLGLRGEEPTMPKPAGVRRLLATGDSSVYGFRVRDDEVFITKTAELLGGAEAKIEGWNAAIPGYSTYQTINMLEMRALALEPDVLVIANLWSDNNFDAFVDKELLAAYTTFEGSSTHQMHRLLQGSAFYRLMHYRLTVATGAAAEARKVGWTVGSGKQIGRRRVEVNDYAENLDRLVEMATRVGAEVVFVLLSNEEDLKGPREEPAAWQLYRDVMRETAKRHGAPLVDVPEMFYKSGLGKQDLFLDEMHPTAKGHGMIAEKLAEALKPWAETGAPLMTAGSGEPRPVYSDHFTFGAGGAGADAAVPGAEPPKPGGEGPAQDVSQATWTLDGELRYAGFSGKRAQIDAVRAGQNPPRVLRAVGLTEPGAFRLNIPAEAGDVAFLVYDDLTGNGPSADDKRYDLSASALTVTGNTKGVLIDVEAGTVSVAP